MPGAPERVWFDPSTRSHVYVKRWLFTYTSLILLTLIGVSCMAAWEHNLIQRFFSGEWADIVFASVVLSLAGYAALAMVINRTTIRVNPTRLVVSRGPVPIPFLGKIDLAKEHIKGIEMFRDVFDGERSRQETDQIIVVTDKERFIIIEFGIPGLDLLGKKRCEEQARQLYHFLRRVLQFDSATPKPVTKFGQ